MVYRRERPKIRRILQGLMDDYGWSAWELQQFTTYDPVYSDCDPVFSLWYTWRTQLRKMIEEENNSEVVLK